MTLITQDCRVGIDRLNTLITNLVESIPINDRDEYSFLDEDKYPDEIAVLADKHLITPNGRPFIEAMSLVNCPIVAGEKDSFGWLSAVIKTPVGKIVY